MIQQLIIRLLPNQNQQELRASWLISRSEGTESGQGSLTELQTMFDHWPVNTKIWMPAEDIALTSAKIPSTQARHIQKALPFAIEESLAQDVDDMHLVAGSKFADGRIMVAAVSKAQMQHWQEQLQSFDINSQEWLIDAQMLASDKTRWQLLLEDDGAILNAQEKGLFKIEKDNLFYLLDGLVLEEDVISCDLHHQQGEDVSLILARLENELNGSFNVTAHNYSNSIELLADLSIQLKKPINLQQGEFKLKTQKAAKANPFKVPLSMAAALAIIATSINGIQAYNLNKQAKEVNRASVAYYKQLFPEARRVNSGSLKKRVQAKLKNIGSSDTQAGFLTSLDNSGAVLKKLGLSKDMAFTSFRYSDRTSELAIDIEGKDVGQFEKFKLELIKSGSPAELGSITNENNVVKGRIKLGGKNG